MRISSVLIMLSMLVLVAGCDRTFQQTADSPSIDRAFAEHARDVQVKGEGVVTRILADDKAGSQHQRFVVRVASGQTVLIEHNIELAPRIEDLREGAPVSFSGEYIWNEQGGLIHWTHHDPAQKHQAGWIKHKGRTYQ